MDVQPNRISLQATMLIFVMMLSVQLLAACQPAEADLETEIAYLGLFAAEGKSEELADLLDNSMVLISAGEFTLGSQSGHRDERPLRQIYLDAYEIDRNEVTNAQYQRFVLAHDGRPPQHWQGTDYPAGQGDWPATGVSWVEADAYCTWMGKRLPTEAEWEKACRGPEGSIYPWGNDWEPGRANTGIEHAENWPPTVEDLWLLLEVRTPRKDYPQSLPVGSFPQGASTYGVLDMAGNASEWVLDWYNWGGYQELADRNPIGTEPPWNHAVRGSGWVDKDGEQDLVADLSRCSKRNSSNTSNDPRLGFRCARSAE